MIGGVTGHNATRKWKEIEMETKTATRCITKGKRVEILKALYANGVLPYRSLKLFDGETTLTQSKALQMVKEEEIVRLGKGRESHLALNDDWWNGTTHWKDVDEVYINRRMDIDEELSRGLREGGTSRLNRLGKRAELNLMMHQAGIGSYPDERPKMGENDFTSSEPIYYSADEVKKATVYSDKTEKKDGVKQVTNSRLAGLMVAPDRMYATYSLGKKLIEWDRFGEIRMKNIIQRTVGEKNKELVQNPMDCIIFADEYSVFERVVLSGLETQPVFNTKTLLNIDAAYDHMYALPTDKNGIALLEEMKREEWLDIMKGILLEGYEEPEVGLNVVCDAVDEDKYILMFTSCDISRLQSFIKRAHSANDRDRFIIYCFSFQTQLVRRLAGDDVTIWEIELSDYKEEVERLYGSSTEEDN